jgi:hypothetical protein
MTELESQSVRLVLRLDEQLESAEGRDIQRANRLQRALDHAQCRRYRRMKLGALTPRQLMDRFYELRNGPKKVNIPVIVFEDEDKPVQVQWELPKIEPKIQELVSFFG